LRNTEKGVKKMLDKQLKKYRKKISWSQQKLAEKAGLSYNAITKIEQGSAKNPTIQTIAKIADAFNVSIDELIGKKRK
ncbi:helix-turn-helix domain-containing protein, partial [bacterium]